MRRVIPFVAMATLLSLVVNGNSLDEKYKIKLDASGFALCCTDSPTATTETRSLLDCARSCSSLSEGCDSVNYRSDIMVCYLFQDAMNFAKVDSCRYYAINKEITTTTIVLTTLLQSTETQMIKLEPETWASEPEDILLTFPGSNPTPRATVGPAFTPAPTCYTTSTNDATCCMFPATVNGIIITSCLQLTATNDPNTHLCFVRYNALRPCTNSAYGVDNITTSLTVPNMATSIMVATVNNWITFQQRVDGSQSFDLKWVDYRNGFGTNTQNFWIGLEVLYQLTNNNVYRLRMEAFSPTKRWISDEYSIFYIDSEYARYRLHVSAWDGENGNPLMYPQNQYTHNGMAFSTIDSDNDNVVGGSCALSFGAFWWNKCGTMCPNAKYGASLRYFIPSTGGASNIRIMRMMMKMV